MAYTLEPDITASRPEAAFQAAIKCEIEEMLGGKAQETGDEGLRTFFVLEGFGLDLAVFLGWSDGHRALKLLELKVFVGSRPGGVGFGNQQGEGPQIELLLLPDPQFQLGDAFCRWVLMDGTMPLGADRFSIFSNTEARAAAMGGARKGKQNNLRVAPLRQSAVNWDGLSEALEQFLTS